MEEISRELDKNDKEPEVKVVEKIVEVPVEVEKIVEVPVEVEKIVEKELPTDPIIAEALKHARRARKK